MKARERDYRDEYDSYHKKPEQKKRRAQRNKARRSAMRSGTVHKGDGKEVHHSGASRTGSLAGVSTKVISRAENRKMQPKRK